MFGLKLPALATAGAVAVLAVGGLTALPAPAVAADGDPGTSSAVTSGAADGTGGAAADEGADEGGDEGGDGDRADGGAVADTGTAGDPAADPGAGTSTGTSTATPTDAAAGTAPATAGGTAPLPDAPAPGSSASGSAGKMNVSPQTVAPGGEVTLRLDASCTAGHKAQASAEAFVSAVTLAPASDGNGLVGSAFIKSDAAEGSYAIAVDCDGVAGSAEASVTVSRGGSDGSADGVPVSPPVTSQKPVKPVPAGGGAAAAQLAAGPATAGSSAFPLLTTGAFAAAGLTGLVVNRRRTAARRD